MNFSFGLTNRTAPITGAHCCHHGAEVLSGTRHTPLPCFTNLSSHGTSPLRPPNGGFIHTNPAHVSVKLRAVIQDCAGIHGTISGPGDATSTSNVSPIAAKTCGGVYHSSVAPTGCSCNAMTYSSLRFGAPQASPRRLDCRGGYRLPAPDVQGRSAGRGVHSVTSVSSTSSTFALVMPTSRRRPCIRRIARRSISCTRAPVTPKSLPMAR